MCYEEITCPRCSSHHVRKNGKTLQRKQRFQCKNCRRQFITDYTNLGCLPEIRWLIVVLTLNDCGVRESAPFTSVPIRCPEQFARPRRKFLSRRCRVVSAL